jgi:hypothetical protein
MTLSSASEAAEIVTLPAIKNKTARMIDAGLVICSAFVICLSQKIDYPGHIW